MGCQKIAFLMTHAFSDFLILEIACFDFSFSFMFHLWCSLPFPWLDLLFHWNLEKEDLSWSQFHHTLIDLKSWIGLDLKLISSNITKQSSFLDYCWTWHQVTLLLVFVSMYLAIGATSPKCNYLDLTFNFEFFSWK